MDKPYYFRLHTIYNLHTHFNGRFLIRLSQLWEVRCFLLLGLFIRFIGRVATKPIYFLLPQYNTYATLSICMYCYFCLKQLVGPFIHLKNKHKYDRKTYYFDDSIFCCILFTILFGKKIWKDGK